MCRFSPFLRFVLFSNLMSLFIKLGDRASRRRGRYRVCMHNWIGVCGTVRHCLTFTPLLRSIHRAHVAIHPVRVAKEEGVLAFKSPISSDRWLKYCKVWGHRSGIQQKREVAFVKLQTFPHLSVSKGVLS